MLGLILAGIAVACLGAAIYFAIIYWDDIVAWFQQQSIEELTSEDKDNIGFNLVERLNSGQYKTVHGIFNQRTDQVLDGRKVISESIDNKTKQMHGGNELAVLR